MINELEEIQALFDEFYLIEEPLKNEVKESENPIKINFEGGNKTGLVFVFENPLSDADKEMIHNLVHKAMKLTMEDVALIYLHTMKGVSYEQMINVINGNKVIVWGAFEWISESVGAINKYEVTPYRKSTLISVDVVSAFMNNVPLKTVLWNSIQSLIKQG